MLLRLLYFMNLHSTEGQHKDQSHIGDDGVLGFSDNSNPQHRSVSPSSDYDDKHQ